MIAHLRERAHQLGQLAQVCHERIRYASVTGRPEVAVLARLNRDRIREIQLHVIADLRAAGGDWP